MVSGILSGRSSMNSQDKFVSLTTSLFASPSFASTDNDIHDKESKYRLPFLRPYIFSDLALTVPPFSFLYKQMTTSRSWLKKVRDSVMLLPLGLLVTEEMRMTLMTISKMKTRKKTRNQSMRVVSFRSCFELFTLESPSSLTFTDSRFSHAFKLPSALDSIRVFDLFRSVMGSEFPLSSPSQAFFLERSSW